MVNTISSVSTSAVNFVASLHEKVDDKLQTYFNFIDKLIHNLSREVDHREDLLKLHAERLEMTPDLQKDLIEILSQTKKTEHINDAVQTSDHHHYLDTSYDFLKAFIEAKTIFLPSPSKNPDADSWGPISLLAKIATNLGKEVIIGSVRGISDKWERSVLGELKDKFINWEKPEDLEKLKTAKPDLTIVSDSSDLDVFFNKAKFREMLNTVNPEMTLVKLDHHQEGSPETNFGDINVVNPVAPSTSLMILDIFTDFGKALEENFAKEGINKGVEIFSHKLREIASFATIADTFSFTNIKNNALEFFSLMKTLTRKTIGQKAISVEELSQHFNLEASPSILLLKEGLKNASLIELENGTRVLISELSHEFIQKNLIDKGIKFDTQDVELLKSVLGKGVDYDVVLFAFDYMDAGKLNKKYTLRHAGSGLADFNVDTTIREAGFRGGGHLNTGGWSSPDNISEALEKLKPLMKVSQHNSVSPAEIDHYGPISLGLVTGDIKNYASADDMEFMKYLVKAKNSENSDYIDNLDHLSSTQRELKILGILSKAEKDKIGVVAESKLATAIIVRLLEYTNLLTENVDKERWILDALDLAVAKGGNYSKAVAYVDKYNFQELKNLGDKLKLEADKASPSNFIQEKVKLLDNKEANLSIYRGEVDLNKELDFKFFNFLKHSTLNAYLLSQVKEKNSEGSSWGLYHNAKKIDEDTDATKLYQRHFA